MRTLRYFLLLVFALNFVACADDPDPDVPDPVDRTVLAYIAGNNSLSTALSNNIDAMCQGMRGVGGNLIVYFASTSASPQLFKIGSDGSKELLKTYEKHNSVDPAIFRSVVNEVFGQYPANSYGLVLSSHGEGWLPAPTSAKARMQIEQRYSDAPLTKYFGQDGSSFMNITDLASALPSGRKLDFLLFDACFMSSVEALYDLRNNAKHIIASPTEVMGTGFPYDKIAPQMFSPNLDLKKICQSFVDSYRGAAQYPSASVALVNTSELEALAGTVQALYANHPNVSLDLTKIQSLELKYSHTYYDMDDYLSQLSGGDVYYQAFQTQLGKVVEFVDYTPMIFSAFVYPRGDYFTLNRSCGISAFIPQSVPGYRSAYLNTAWAQAVGFQ